MNSFGTPVLTAVAVVTAGVVCTAPQTAAEPPACHSSYDPCVPIDSDVDCLVGDGDGPAYTGPVRVLGPDDYGLDRDGNGTGCEES